jgi:hypothetical protein
VAPRYLARPTTSLHSKPVFPHFTLCPLVSSPPARSATSPSPPRDALPETRRASRWSESRR